MRHTEVKHSGSNNAWKIIGTALGGRYNIARVDYLIFEHEGVNAVEKAEAYKRACRISRMFNMEGL